jgi:hypothetical protein
MDNDRPIASLCVKRSLYARECALRRGGEVVVVVVLGRQRE